MNPTLPGALQKRPRGLGLVLGLIEADLALLLFSLPVLYGGVHTWWYLISSANALLLLALCAAALLMGASISRAALIFPSLFLLAALLQQSPLPPVLLRTIAPGVAELKAPLVSELGLSSLQPVALAVSSSAFWAGMLAQMSIVFLAAAILAPERKRMARLAGVVAAAAVIQLAYGAIELREGGQVLLPLERKVYRGFLTGTFVNRNHFADYLLLGFGAALGLTASGYHRFREGRAGPLPFLVSGIAAVLTGSGVVFAGSRGALLALFVGSIVALVAIVFLAVRSELLVPALTVTVFVLAVTLLFGGDVVFERFLDIRREFAGSYSRPVFWSAALRQSAASPVIGTGWGSFESAWIYFSGGVPQLDSLKVSHVHNDWLEMLAAFGLVAFAAGGGLLLWLAASFMRTIRSRSTSRGLLLAGFVLATTGFAVHMTVDFPLAIPALGCTAATAAGFLTRPRQEPGPRLKYTALLFFAFALPCLVWSFSWSLDGIRGRASGILYPGKRADLTAAEAREAAAAGAYDKAFDLLREAVRDRPADAFLWAEIASLPSLRPGRALSLMERALELSPRSLFVGKCAIRLCFRLLPEATNGEAERISTLIRSVLRDASPDDARRLAEGIFSIAGGLDEAAALIGERDSLPLLLALPSLGRNDELLWRLNTVTLEVLKRWAREPGLHEALEKMRPTPLWEECVLRLAECIRPSELSRSLRRKFIFRLVRTGRPEAALSLLEEGWFADSALLDSLVRFCTLPPEKAARILENFENLAALTKKDLSLFLYGCDRLSRGGYRTLVLETLQSLRRMLPSERGIDLRIAELLAARGDYEEAVVLLKRHLDLVKRYPRFRDVLAECYRALGYARELDELLSPNGDEP